MFTENLSTLKIHKLTQEQYDRELANGNIDATALYLTPDNPTLIQLGVTATAYELNYVDGVTSNIQTQLNNKAEKSHTHNAIEVTSNLCEWAESFSSQLRQVDFVTTADTPTTDLPSDSTEWSYASGTLYIRYGFRTLVLYGYNGAVAVRGYDNSSWSEWKRFDTKLTDFGITATAAELNKLDGVTATATEINYIDGVTSNIQAQLDNKAAKSHNHSASDINSGTLSSDRLPTVPIANGGTGATTAADALTNLGIKYGSTLPSSGTEGQIFFLLDE